MCYLQGDKGGMGNSLWKAPFQGVCPTNERVLATPLGETEGSSTTNICMKVTAADGLTDENLQKFWLVEEVPGDAPDLETEERQAVEPFLDTTYRGEDG